MTYDVYINWVEIGQPVLLAEDIIRPSGRGRGRFLSQNRATFYPCQTVRCESPFPPRITCDIFLQRKEHRRRHKTELFNSCHLLDARGRCKKQTKTAAHEDGRANKRSCAAAPKDTILAAAEYHYSDARSRRPPPRPASFSASPTRHSPSSCSLARSLSRRRSGDVIQSHERKHCG